MRRAFSGEETAWRTTGGFLFAPIDMDDVPTDKRQRIQKRIEIMTKIIRNQDHIISKQYSQIQRTKRTMKMIEYAIEQRIEARSLVPW